MPTRVVKTGLAVTAALLTLTACDSGGTTGAPGPGSPSAQLPSTPPPTLPPPVSASASTPVSFAPAPRLFDHLAVAQGVTQVLTQSFQLSGVRDVTCPEKQPVTVGHTFTCSVVVADAQRTVAVTVRDDQGQYEVGAPK